MNALYIARTISLILFMGGVILTIYAMSQEKENLFLLTSWALFAGSAVFVFTEAFSFKEPVRSKIGIWGARLFFVILVFVVLGLTLSVLRLAL